MDWELVRRAAARSEAIRLLNRGQFAEDLAIQRSLDFSSTIWNSWAGIWNEIVRQCESPLTCDDSHNDLAEALEGLLKAVRSRGHIEKLPEAVQRFDPSYCDGSDSEEEAYAVRIVLDALNAIAGGADAGEIARGILAVRPLPDLRGARTAEHLLLVAESWPRFCEKCGRINPPESFACRRCRGCTSVDGKLGSLARHLACMERHGEEQMGRTADRFPFWEQWRSALRAAYPGLEEDVNLWRRWKQDIFERKEMDWRCMSFDHAARQLPLPASEPQSDATRISPASECADHERIDLDDILSQLPSPYEKPDEWILQKSMASFLGISTKTLNNRRHEFSVVNDDRSAGAFDSGALVWVKPKGQPRYHLPTARKNAGHLAKKCPKVDFDKHKQSAR